MADDDPPPPPPPDEPAEEEEVPPPPPPPTAGDFNDEEGRMLWLIMEAVNEELLVCDPTNAVSEEGVKNIQLEMLDRVFAVISKEGRSELSANDRAFIKKRVRSLVFGALPGPKRRFAKLDRVVCNIGGSRGWAAGSVQALNEEDPSDPTGESRLAYVVKIDPPDSRLVSVPEDHNDYARAEVCFGQRTGAREYTRSCLPKAIRKGSQRTHRRFKQGARVACAVEDSTGDYTEWAAGTVQALDHPVEELDGVPGGLAPYEVRLDSGATVLVHMDEHWLVRDLELQPAGPRIAADGTRCVQRISKRPTDSGWETVDHMCASSQPCNTSSHIDS